MNIVRIYAILLRYIYNFKHSYDRITDTFYWPALDLLLWGLTGYYYASLNENATVAVTAVLSGMIFWIIVWRAQYEVTVNLLTELWDKNLVNLFGSPLRFSEWILSVMVIGIIKGAISFLFAVGLVFLLYQINIFMFGFYIPVFIALLLLSGWAVGFLVAGIIFRYGTKIQTLAWSLIWAIAPFAAIFYPLTILPSWARFIAQFFPQSYVFEQIRSFVFYHTVDPKQLFIAFILSILYLTIGLIIVRNSFYALRNKGLTKLY